ncbi:MAG: peptidoglycan-binding domain-containing protein [Candidatus Omnitrophota bacterium]
MLIKMVLSVFLVCVLAGCATGSKKQSRQLQPQVFEKSQKAFEQDSSSLDYGQAAIWPSDSYEIPVKKTYSDAVIQLSPKQIQRALKSAGFYQGSVDGKIGAKTKKAIIEFQKANSLKADGIVGKRTSVELHKHLSR